MSETKLANNEYIRSQFSWDSEEVYEWTFHNRDREVTGLVGGFLGGGVVFPGLIYFVFYLVALWSPGVAFWMSAVFTGFLALVLVMHYYMLIWGKDEEKIQARSIIYWNAIAAIGTLMYMAAGPGSKIASDFIFSVENVTFWHWVLFLWDNTVSVFLLDIPEVFNLQTSPITHGGWISKVFTVVLRLLVTIGILEMIIDSYQSFAEQRTIYATPKKLYWFCEGLPDDSGIEVYASGKVHQTSEKVIIRPKEYIAAFVDEAKAEEEANSV